MLQFTVNAPIFKNARIVDDYRPIQPKTEMIL